MVHRVHGLVPITREVLHEFYKQHPLDPPLPASEADAIKATLESKCAQLAALSPDKAKQAEAVFGLEVPLRLDDNFWRARMLFEEIAHSLEGLSKKCPQQSTQLLEYKKVLLKAEEDVRLTQHSNTQAAAAQVKQFLPQDFRASFVESRRAAKEAAYAKAVDDLARQGGSIRDKYNLMMQQQWERRESLVQLGNLSGIYKFLVKYLGGVPQVLLDFAKEINAKEGPMEEQRLKYGPDIYVIMDVGVQLNVFCALWLANADATADRSQEFWEAAELGIHYFCHHFVRVVKFLGKIFVKSPFFVTKEEIERATMASANGVSHLNGDATGKAQDAEMNGKGADVALEDQPHDHTAHQDAHKQQSHVHEQQQPQQPHGHLGNYKDRGVRRRSTGQDSVLKPSAAACETAAMAKSGGMQTRPRPSNVAVTSWHQQHNSHHSNAHADAGDKMSRASHPSSPPASEFYHSCADQSSILEDDHWPQHQDLHSARSPHDTTLPSPPPHPTHPHTAFHHHPAPPSAPTTPFHPVNHPANPTRPPPPPHPTSTSTSLHVNNPSRGGGSSISSTSSRVHHGLVHAHSESVQPGAEHISASPHGLAGATSQSSVTMTSMSSTSQLPPPHALQVAAPGHSGRTTHGTPTVTAVASSSAGGAGGGEASSLTGHTLATSEDGSSIGSMSQPGTAVFGGGASDAATVGSPKPPEGSIGLASVMEEDGHPGKQLSSLNLLSPSASDTHAQDGSMHASPSRLSTQSPGPPSLQQQQQQQQQHGQQQRQAPMGERKQLQPHQTRQGTCCLVQ